MPTPGTYPSTTTISFSQVNTEFGLTTPSPMNAKFRIAPGNYTPALNPIPTTPGPSTPASLATFPMDILHGRTKGVPAPTPFITTFTTPGSWTSTVTGNIKVLVVAGGGAGGNYSAPAAFFPALATWRAGGGGGGGVVYCTSFPVVIGTVYPFTVGGAGQNSNFKAVINANAGGGGGLGGGAGGSLGGAGGPGGSGGGGGAGTTAGNAGGTATQPGVPQPANCTNYGSPGGPGSGTGGTKTNGGPGGGAGGPAGPRQAGISISITGAPVIYGAGGINNVGPLPGYGNGGRGGFASGNDVGTPPGPGNAGCVIIAYP